MRDYEKGQLRAAIPKEVASAIRAARVGKGWTQQRLADRSQVSRKTVNRVELFGKPDTDTLMRLCGALGLRVVDLVPDWRRQDDDDDVPSLKDALFGHRVRQRRRELGLKLVAVAAEAGVSVATLSRFERLASTSTKMLTPVYDDDPEGEVFLANEGLAQVLGFKDIAELNAYCR